MTSRGTVLGTFVVLCVGILIGGAVQADPLFNPEVPYSVGDEPGWVAMGDLDGDEDLDLVVANEGSDNVSVLLGNGAGSFLQAVNYAVGPEPSYVAVGLFDAGDALDLAVAIESSNNVSILLGNGDGTFQAAVDYTTGWSPTSVAVGDVNEDNDLDLVVSNHSDSDVSVLMGNGDGTFLAAVDYGVGVSSNPSEVAIGYVDGDSHLDLATSNQFSSDVSVLLGNGDGTFQMAVHYDLDDYTYPSAVAIGHLNPDGYADLVVANEFGPDISVLLGNGNGTFQAAVDYAAGTSPFSVGIEDLDLDGNADVAVANWTSTGVVWVFLGNGDGILQTGQSYATGSKAASVAIGDLDNDHVQDLAVANYGSDTVSVLLNLKEACNDTDGDGYGSPLNPSCAYAGDDCDNDNSDINPGASETCNGVDDDCDGNTADGADEAWMGTLCDGPDLDECDEGTYSCEGGLQACSDDTDDDVEVCDGLDNNCDGFLGDWETDDDGDHYVECVSWEGTDPEIDGGRDCNDHDAARNPGLEENLTAGNCEDGKDNDCDDLIDVEEPGCPTPGPCADVPAG